MWSKIITDNDVLVLKAGDILLKYPITGAATEVLVLKDAYNIERYCVADVDALSGSIDLVEDVNTTSSNPFVEDQTKTITDEQTLVHMPLVQLITECKWWREF